MTDLAITAANVAPGSDAQTERRNAGATIAQGQPMYIDSSDTWQLADGDGAAALRVATHISLSSGASGQPMIGQKIVSGTSITIGGTMVLGVVYCLSGNVGKICPSADVGSGNFLQVIGIPTSTTVMKLSGVNAGVAT